MTGIDDDLSLASGRQPRGAALLASLETYWRGLIRNGRLPARQDIDPAGIDAVLPWCFVGEKVAPQVVRLRVAGHRLTDALGMEPRGMPLCSFFSPEARAALGPLVDRTFGTPAVTELGLISARRLVRPRFTARMILLPLCDHAGNVSRVIGALVCEGPTGRSPARFDLSGEAPRCEPLILAGAPRLASVGAGHPADSGPTVARPALRLVISND